MIHNYHSNKSNTVLSMKEFQLYKSSVNKAISHKPHKKTTHELLQTLALDFS